MGYTKETKQKGNISVPDGDNEDFSKEKNKVTAIMSKMANRVKVLFKEFLLILRTLDL